MDGGRSDYRPNACVFTVAIVKMRALMESFTVKRSTVPTAYKLNFPSLLSHYETVDVFDLSEGLV